MYGLVEELPRAFYVFGSFLLDFDLRPHDLNRQLSQFRIKFLGFPEKARKLGISTPTGHALTNEIADAHTKMDGEPFNEPSMASASMGMGLKVG